MEDKTEMPEKEITTNDGKTIAIISYITIIGLIIAFIMNNEKKNAFASYHIRQSLGIAATALALTVIGIIPILGWIISFFGFFFIFVLWIIGLINALNSKEKPLPVLGKKYEEWFKDVK
ncbi:MAG: hypothetical protein L3J23_06570 [Flavobacteriaceae bacterium]|nr:hypothetical protein [Flavobacteriaceae bacterium]